jgi:hypothetical protein
MEQDIYVLVMKTIKERIMSKTNKSDEQARRATTLIVYKRLLEKGKIRLGGAADKRYNELLKRRIK